MLFLADEMFKQKNNTFKATIGKPIAWQELDKSKTSFEWAQYIKGKVYNLKNKKNKEKLWKKLLILLMYHL